MALKPMAIGDTISIGSGILNFGSCAGGGGNTNLVPSGEMIHPSGYCNNNYKNLAIANRSRETAHTIGLR